MKKMYINGMHHCNMRKIARYTFPDNYVALEEDFDNKKFIIYLKDNDNLDSDMVEYFEEFWRENKIVKLNEEEVFDLLIKLKEEGKKIV